MKGILKDTLILFVITLVAGICLGAAHEVTKEPIAKAQQEAANATYREVYPEADNFASTDALTAAVAAAADEISAQGFGNVTVDEAMEAQDADGNAIGHLVIASSNDGYNGLVQISVGITNEGTLTGIGFLSISETPGLGMKAKEPEFKDQFAGKAATGRFELVKSGAAGDGEVQAISGATFTSTAVTGAVNAAVYFAENCIAE